MFHISKLMYFAFDLSKTETKKSFLLWFFLQMCRMTFSYLQSKEIKKNINKNISLEIAMLLIVSLIQNSVFYLKQCCFFSWNDKLHFFLFRSERAPRSLSCPDLWSKLAPASFAFVDSRSRSGNTQKAKPTSISWVPISPLNFSIDFCCWFWDQAVTTFF
jgi:hypothetical protein